MALVAAGASTSLAGVLLLTAGPDTAGLVISVLAGGLTAATLGAKGAFRLLRRVGASPTAMAIVPWGVLIRPDEGGTARVLRWSGVKTVYVDFIHTRDVSGTSSTPWSFVTIETGRERLVGRTAGHVALERLIAHLDAYARESSTPVALDLAGQEPGPLVGFEPVARELIGRVRDFILSGVGVEALGLGAGSYRGVSSGVPTSETIDALRLVLRESSGTPADRRAFAALVAGELGAAALVPELLRLVTAAHPFVAVAAKAALLRLGVEPNKAGSLAEVAPFLHDDDLFSLGEWIGPGVLPEGLPGGGESGGLAWRWRPHRV